MCFCSSTLLKNCSISHGNQWQAEVQTCSTAYLWSLRNYQSFQLACTLHTNLARGRDGMKIMFQHTCFKSTTLGLHKQKLHNCVHICRHTCTRVCTHIPLIFSWPFDVASTSSRTAGGAPLMASSAACSKL